MIIYTDGACSGNPGPMGIGVALVKDGKILDTISKKIGDGTNNIAEYTAVLEGIKRAKELGETDFMIRSDSLLLVKQLNGEYRIKQLHLKELKGKIDKEIKNLHVEVEYIPREENKEADKLAKKAIL